MAEARVGVLRRQGGPLSWVEELCLRSFLAAGHRVVLMHYEGAGDPPQEERESYPEAAV